MGWRLGTGGGGRVGRREESIQHDLHKPSHLSLGNNFFSQSAFSNGMVYNNATLWSRHANQHQNEGKEQKTKGKLIRFPSNKGCQGDSTMFECIREVIPFQSPPLVSTCPLPHLEIPARLGARHEPCLEEEARGHPWPNHLVSICQS